MARRHSHCGGRSRSGGKTGRPTQSKPEMKVAFEQKIRLGFALALAFLLVLGGIALWAAARSIAAFRGVDQTQQVLAERGNVSIGLINAETSARSYVFTGDELKLKPYRSGAEAVERARLQLRKLTRNDPQMQSSLDALGPLLATRLASLAAIVQQRRGHDFETASKNLAAYERDPLTEQVRNRLAEMEVRARRQLDT